MKVRYEPFETHTRQMSTLRVFDDDEEIARLALKLFEQFPLKRRIRLIGVAAGELRRTGDEPAQLPLFNN